MKIQRKNSFWLTAMMLAALVSSLAVPIQAADMRGEQLVVRSSILEDPLVVSDLDLLQSTDLSIWDDVPGSFAGGFHMLLDPAVSYYYLDAANLVVNHPLVDGYHEFFVDTYPTGYFDYWATRGVIDGAGGWEGIMWEIINGRAPIFYLKVAGTDYDLIDGLQKLAGGGDNPLRIEGSYLPGDYTFTGLVTDTGALTDDVNVGITFYDITAVDPLELADFDLLQSTDTVIWIEVPGSLPGGFSMALDTTVDYYYFDAANLVVNRPLAQGHHYFKITSWPDGFFDYWASRGVTAESTGDAAVMWQIITGQVPFFCLSVEGDSLMLIDAFQRLIGQGDHPLRVDGTYLPGNYLFSGQITDVLGYDNWVTVDITFNDNPVLAPIGAQSIGPNQLLTFTATATDVGNPPLTFSLENAPSGASIDPASGVFTWTPTLAQANASYNITFKVCDSGSPSLCDQEIVTVTVGAASSEKAIITFTIPTGTTVINEAAKTITVTVPFGTAVTALIPTITVSPNATVSPLSGVAQDFTNPVTYTVTAEDSSTQNYLVTVVSINPMTITKFSTHTGTLGADYKGVEVSFGWANGLNMDLISSITVSLKDSLGDVMVTNTAKMDRIRYRYSTGEREVNSAFIIEPGAYSTSRTWEFGPWTPVIGIKPVTAQIVVTGVNGDTRTYTKTPLQEVGDGMAPWEDLFSSEKSILTFSIPTGTTTINEIGKSITVVVPLGTNLTSLVPTITVSPYATVSPLSGVAQDFTDPVIYTVTAHNSTTQPYTVTVIFENGAPTDIQLLDNSIPENQPSDTVVGALTTTDPNSGDTFTYTLVTGEGSADNSSFAISGSNLISKAVFDFEVKSVYYIRVQSADQDGLSVEKAMTVTITDANDAPVLDAIGSKSANPGVLLTFTATASDSDLPANTLTFSLEDAPTGASITSGGVFSWTPTPAQANVTYENIKVKVCDNGAPILCDEELITITVSPNTGKAILSFNIPTGTTVINEAAKTITVTMPPGTDASGLVPTITVSPFATINPLSGVVQDFSSAVTYTVTAQDGSTQEYVVTVIVTPYSIFLPIIFK
ncbi:MAG: putative Ig domain-containing protein [Anaerolineales bacterium]|nr:putative Ig domain-containing protein [Anaerolineales bacterium]